MYIQIIRVIKKLKLDLLTSVRNYIYTTVSQSCEFCKTLFIKTLFKTKIENNFYFKIGNNFKGKEERERKKQKHPKLPACEY